MKIAVFGGTGFIGKHLASALLKQGHEPLILDLRRNPDWEKSLGICDAVVNLAGLPLFKHRWSSQVMAEIHSSRVEGTRKIVAALGRIKKNSGKTLTMINASAIGIYGTSRSEIFTEDVQNGTDFLSFVCHDWEAEAHKADICHQIRTVVCRIGIVLGKNGGALEKLTTPFNMFVGGPINCGHEWMSWIHIDDVVGFILYALKNENIRGVYNLTAPNPVTNKVFSKALGHALERPSWLPLPSIALRIAVGQSANVITRGQCVLPKRTLESGYVFQYADIYVALEQIFRSGYAKPSAELGAVH